MFCIHCGDKNKDIAKFCISCGQELSVIENDSNDYNNPAKHNIKHATIATTNKPSFKNFYFSAKGRISRKEFFLKGFIPTSLMVVILLLGANFLSLQEASKANVFTYSLIVVLSIVVMVAQFTVSIKRLHDYDANGWWSISLLIPIVNFITLMLLFFKSPSNKKNKYGDKPETYALTPFKWFIFILSVLLIWAVTVTNGVLTLMNKEQDTQKINEIEHSKPEFEHPKSEIEHSKPKISVNATINPYEIDINTIIKWYNADTGLNNQPGVTDGFKIKNQTSESVRYNGEIRGWSYWYNPKGTKGIKRRKFFYNPDDSNADSKGRVSGKWFRYYYCQETEYARFGDGENYPLFWLKDGKPFDGQLKIGEGQLGWYSVAGDCKGVNAYENFYENYNVNNGLVNGPYNEIYGKISGTYKNGFKHGDYEYKSEAETKMIEGYGEVMSLSESTIAHYKMGKRHGKYISKLDGKTMIAFNYNNGIPDGWNYEFYENGLLRIKALVENGKVIRGEWFDEYGNKNEVSIQGLSDWILD